MHPLISTDWLAAHLGAVQVFDATYYLPNEGIDARARFRASHLPGARFFDVDGIADTDSAFPHMVPAAGRFEAMISALGISNDTCLVFYDQKGIFSAPRAWWLMRLFGHANAAVLDGGLPAWRDEGRPLESGDATTPQKGSFRAALHARRLRGLGDILRNIESGQELLLDARSKGRFDGTEPEPRPGLQSGHVPGSASLPANTLLSQGHFLPADALRSRFSAAGVTAATKVITSCGSGISAAILTLGLVLAGLDEGALYDGSWTEWAARDETPKLRV